jgi:hypothetical protein
MATTADLEALQAEATTAAPDARHRWPFGAHGDDWLREVADASQAPDPRWCEWQARQGEWAAALPAGLVSVQYEKDDPTVVERCLAAMARDGAVVLANAVRAETCDRVRADMAPYVEAGSFLGGFFGERLATGGRAIRAPLGALHL